MTAVRGALVTGAARRIGRAIAEGLAADGWHVAIHYNDSAEDAAAAVAAIEAAGGKAVGLAADLADAQAIPDLVARAAEATGGLTCLVNNASRFAEDRIADISAESFDASMAVNLRAPVLLAQAFAAALPGDADGVVVNLLDQKLVNPNPDFFSYTLSKYALAGSVETLAMALAPRVRVVGVAPGLTLPSGDQTGTQFAAVHARTPLGRGSAAGDIAGAVRYLVAADAVTGTTLLVDGGQHLVPSDRDVMFASFDDLRGGDEPGKDGDEG